ncbi:hypothetical protein EDC04DRAFT_2870958 [Pisolithus marmoratus]|nr:hypothetical protein EDC04DRAFT_2870958 [Pisolithus marmoratus]
MKYGLAAVNQLLDVCGQDQAVGHDIGCVETCKCIFSSSNNMAPLICHASGFHWKQFLGLHFSQWDLDKYLELSKQVLHIIQTSLADLEQFKCSKNITDNDFETWHWEGLEYLKQCTGESDATLIVVQYVELLEKLNFAE